MRSDEMNSRTGEANAEMEEVKKERTLAGWHFEKLDDSDSVIWMMQEDLRRMEMMRKKS